VENFSGLLAAFFLKKNCSICIENLIYRLGCYEKETLFFSANFCLLVIYTFDMIYPQPFLFFAIYVDKSKVWFNLE
jgi:hypothetical protein